VSRTVRAGGLLLVGALALFVLHGLLPPAGNLAEKVPVYATVLVLYAIAFLTMTASGSAIGTRALVVGAGTGCAAALLWLLPVLVRPPLPTSGGWATMAVVTAAIVAAAVSPGPVERLDQRLFAGLCAGTVAALQIVASVYGLIQYLPRWVPDIGGRAIPPTVSAADRLASNRGYAEDPYVAVLFLGCLLAVALTVAAIATRQRRPAVP